MKGLFRFHRHNPGQVRAWATYDFANSAFATTILAVIFNKYYAGVVAGGPEGVLLGGVRIPGASMFTVFVAAGMLLIAATSPFLAALSDLSGLKKRLLGVYLGIGLTATALMATVSRGEWLWGGLLFILGQIGFAGGNVFYNSMLHDIADQRDYGKVSGIGWAWGYIGGGTLLAINMVMLGYPQLLGFPQGYFTVHHCFLSVAVWWGLFSIPLFISVPEIRQSSVRIGESLRRATAQLRGILHRLKDLPHFTRFFFAYLLYNDGIQTIVILAAIFGDQELGLSSTEIIGFFLMIQGIAFLGSLVMGWSADRLGSRRTILITLVGWLIIALWGWKIGLFGQPKTEFWVLGALTGIVMGGSQAASRSLQATLIPPSHSAAFFSFFTISSRFASATGPLIFGLVVFLTGSLRQGILSLIVFFILGFLILLTVNESKGHREALSFDVDRG